MTNNKAIAAALEYTQLTEADLINVSVDLQDGLYEVVMHTGFLAYDMYLDADTCEVLGIMTQPEIVVPDRYDDLLNDFEDCFEEDNHAA